MLATPCCVTVAFQGNQRQTQQQTEQPPPPGKEIRQGNQHERWPGQRPVKFIQHSGDLGNNKHEQKHQYATADESHQQRIRQGGLNPGTHTGLAFKKICQSIHGSIKRTAVLANLDHIDEQVWKNVTMGSQCFMECPSLHNMLANLGKGFGQQRLVCLLHHGVEGIIQRQPSAQKGRHLAGCSGKLAGWKFA